MSAESAEYEVPVEGDRTSVPDAVPMDDSEADTDVFNSTSGQFSFTLFLAILILIGGCAVYLTIKKQKEEDKKFAFFAEMENSQFNITLPPAIDEYYVVKQKSIDDGWEPGQGEPSKEKTETPGRRLGQALMKRAIATIPLIQYMQKEAQGMYRLHQKNMCSLQQWKQFQTAESMVSGELEEVKAEADEVEPGWSQQIWAQAAKYHQLLSERAKATEAQQKQQKASMQTQQMKIELERKQIAEKQAAKSNTIEDEARQEILAEKAAKELTREEENKSAKKSFKPGNGVKKGFLK